MTNTPTEKALALIFRYGGIDGGHHKQWVLDQVVRILAETPDGYAEWLNDFRGDDDGQGHFRYEWDEGIAP
jgi:alpha/beta superfamily hydrolase